MNPFTLVNGEPYPLDMRGELDDTAAFKNFKKYVFSLIFRMLKCLFLLYFFSFFLLGESEEKPQCVFSDL